MLAAFCLFFASGPDARAAKHEMPAKLTIGVTATVVGDADVFNLKDCFLPDSPPECCVGNDCISGQAKALSDEDRLLYAREALRPDSPEINDRGGS